MFEPNDLYPDLLALQKHWKAIKAEAINSKSVMIDLGDWRAEKGMWKVLPLLLEEEDKGVVPDKTVSFFRSLVPVTVKLVGQIPEVKSFAFSLVEPGGYIKAHQHENPYVSASLCLHDGGRNNLIVEQESRILQQGDLAVFDYRKTHAVYNWGSQFRIALIVALPCERIAGR
jgi:aspartyl/asparaginyl beta-hydroxylase (cupin superfamily)